MANYLDKKEKTIDSQIQAVINTIDIVPNFIQQWQAIDSQYKEIFKFDDKLEDSIRILEYQKVNSQYKKFVKEKGKKIKKELDKPINVITMINKWLEIDPQIPESGWSRWFIVYTKMSKEWLLVIRKFLNDYIELTNNNKEE